jgi:four helix bundle protein
VDECQFNERIQSVVLRTMKAVESLPRTRAGDVIGRQLLRSVTAIGANYRSACRSRSRADMISRLSIVEEEADETLYWMELLVASGMVAGVKMRGLLAETNELLSMIVASIKTLKKTGRK